MDTVVTYLATDECNKNFTMDKDNLIVELKIPQLYLRGGTYNVSYTISIKQSIASDHLVLDRLENVFELHVEQGDFWQAGGLNRKGGYIQDFNFSII